MSMKLIADDTMRMLRESASRCFAEYDGAKMLRRHRDARDLAALACGAWDGMTELGLSGVIVSEDFGGSGLGFRESVQVSEMMGRSLATGPFLSTAVMAATAVRHGDNDRLKREILPAIAAGHAIIAITGEERTRHRPLAIDTTARRDGEIFRISGRKTAVIDGNIAGKFIVAARDAGVPDKLLLLLVDAGQAAISTTAAMGLDSHPLCEVAFSDAVASADDLICAAENTPALLDQIYDAGRLHLAAEMLGLAQEAFDRAIDYLKTRTQFGRRIGEFQALQHRAAILFGELEIAASLLLKAATLHDTDDTRFPAYASLAKAKVGEVAKRVTAEAVHFHGGIGMTDEFDLGFYLKRARGAAERLGDTAFHQERYAGLGN
jgi:alkylation response protein AidB-like acyl-CoA dehydrogenase